MNNCIETIEYRNQTIKIYPDEDCESPREWDNLGTMICFHKRYNLGDKHNLDSDDFSGWEEMYTYLVKKMKAYIVCPLYLYDHSGLRIKIGNFYGLLPQGHAEFDSGQIGFIYVTAEKIHKEYNVKRITKPIREKVIKILNSEVNVYDDYLTGNVYGYIAETTDGDNIDSCWGFIGDTDYMISEAKSAIDWYIKNKCKVHCEKLKMQIKSHVELIYRKPLII